jgi:plasmid stabilization system protein ParE
VKYLFYREAEAELISAIEYYNAIELRLGLKFAAEVRDCIERILQRPNAWPSFHRQARRCLLHRFPYSVIYAIREKEVVVVAIAHTRRSDAYWFSRLD